MVNVYYNNFPCPSSKRPMVICIRKCALREDIYPNILRIVGYRFQTSIYIWMRAVLTSEPRQPCSRRPLLLTSTLYGPLPNEERHLPFFSALVSPSCFLSFPKNTFFFSILLSFYWILDMRRGRKTSSLEG